MTIIVTRNKPEPVPPPPTTFTLSGFALLHVSVLRNALRKELSDARKCSYATYIEAAETLLEALIGAENS